jgi:transposase
MRSLPEDAAALRALVLATFAERDAAVTERDILQAQNDRLRHLLLKLTRMQFGARSERLPEEQLQLGLEALEQAIAKDEAEAEKRDPELRKDNAAKRRANRGALPAHLPRIEVTLTPEDTACPCCKAPMTVIGEDTSERLDVIPVQFRVIVTKRPKLACRACPGTVVQEPAPARLIEGGIPTEALVACGGVTLRRSSAALSSGSDHGAARRHHRSLHSVVLDGLRGGRGCPGGDAAA